MSAQIANFSLVLGGPLYQLFLRTRLARPPLELLNRRVILFALLTWLPLAILSFVEGHFLGGVGVPFLLDLGTHVRFVLLVPLLIISELIVHVKLKLVIEQFVSREIVRAEDRGRFDDIIASTMRARNSLTAELVIVVLVYSLGHIIMNNQVLQGNAWYSPAADGARYGSLAGYWLTLVSMPIMQFLLCRWYYRLGLWVWFLWRVARLRLQLIPTHPDSVGGLGFLSESINAMVLLVLAHGALVAASIANRIIFDGAILTDFKVEIAVVAVFLCLLIIGPLCIFSPLLVLTKRSGLIEYGSFAAKAVGEFDHKWVHGSEPTRHLLDVGDVQSLADLSGSYDIIRGMKPVPINREAFVSLLLAFLVPILPLVLTIVPAEELFGRLVKILF